MRSESDGSSMGTPRGDAGRLRRCKGCGAIGYDDDIYCAQCGRPFGPICGHCGAPLSHPIAIYCVRCGGKLNIIDHN